VRELAAQTAQALAEAVKAAQINAAAAAPPKPARLRRARPLRTPKRKQPPRKPGQLQDEWGLYDPQVCGFDALYAKLEDQEEQESEQDRPTATELLMRAKQNGHGKALPRMRGPAPLAIWARRENNVGTPGKNGHASDNSNGSNPPVFRAILDNLNLPAPVAAVTYASGCRIHKVRVPSEPRKAKGKTRAKGTNDPDAPVIILSRKALEEVRGRQE